MVATDVPYTDYDKSELYENEIVPKLKELTILCKINRLPFIFSCCPVNKDGESVYKNDGVLTGSSELRLYDDRFVKFLLILRGANVAPLNDISLDDDEAIDYIGNPPVDEDIPSEDEEYENIPEIPYDESGAFEDIGVI